MKNNQEERLTIKELAPYLPYGIDISINGKIQKLNSIDSKAKLVCYGWGDAGFIDTDNVKPLLRPLSQLTEEIEHNGESFVPIDVLGWNSYENIIKKGICDSVGYQYMIKLFEWHFDVFGLHERGLALPIDGKEVEGG